MRPAERESLGECGKEAGSRRQRDPGGRGEGGSAARTEARGRQRGSEGGPETAARLGGRRARRRQRGSEGGTEARRQRGSEDLGRHGGGSAARREARRRFGERECGEVEEAVQCSHSFAVYKMKRTVAKQKQLPLSRSSCHYFKVSARRARTTGTH